MQPNSRWKHATWISRLERTILGHKQSLRKHECREQVPLISGTTVEHDAVRFQHKAAMVATDDGGSLAHQLRRRVQNPVTAEQLFRLSLCGHVFLLEPIELCLAVVCAICIQPSMHENKAAEDRVLLYVYPRAFLEKLLVSLWH